TTVRYLKRFTMLPEVRTAPPERKWKRIQIAGMVARMAKVRFMVSSASGAGGEDGFLVGGAAREFARETAPAQDQDAMGQAEHFVQFGRDEDDGEALGGQRSDQAIDLGLGAHVHAAGGIVQ